MKDSGLVVQARPHALADCYRKVAHGHKWYPVTATMSECQQNNKSLRLFQPAWLI